jgi:hypothetical protein
MRMIRISTEVEVEIDLDDYFDEFLEDADDDDLIKELKDRGYSVEKQALPIKKNEWGVNHEQNKRFLCDLLDIGYHTRNNVLIDLIINNIR